MARKPSALIQYKIRIREDLRRRLAQEAKKRDVSINREMAARLADSFDLPRLDKITTRLEAYGRFARQQLDRVQTQELIDAAEYLIRQLPTEVQDREAVKRGIAWVQEAIKAITNIHGRMYEEGPWEQK